MLQRPSWQLAFIMLMLAAIAAAAAFAQLGEDISGAYEFEHENEFIQLNLENGHLDGYISRLGDEVSDRGTPLTYFFKKARASGTHVTFSTKQVHGVWYSFDGQVTRGSGRVRQDEGFFVLQGQMSLHRVDREKHESVETRGVSLRSLRGNS